jgi:hypothetical protein
MKLFDDFHRDYDGPALYAEPSFNYLNRSARAESGRIRKILEEWFSNYPTKDQFQLSSRFRSTNDNGLRSAFFELFLHELLIRLKCQLKIHPRVNGTTRRPEFLVEDKSGCRFYLEAVLATGESEEDRAEKARMNVVYDVLNRLNSPNFFIGMKFKGAPETPPSARKMMSFLAERLATLNPDELAKIIMSDGFKAVPQWSYEHQGWIIDFFPIPKSPKMRGRFGVRPLGTWFPDVQIIQPHIPLREAVIEKAGRYGDLNLPYVIAVNALDDDVERINIMEALFGEERLVINQLRDARIPNGALISSLGPRYTRVSAVLVASPILPWNVPRAPICLYHNPWTKRPYNGALIRLPQAVPQGDHMELHDGESLGKIFDLPEDWPES